MIPSTSRIFLALEPIDMRSGIDSLSQRVQHTLNHRLGEGNAYVFRNKRRNRLKLLIWDGSGIWLSQRRLHQGSFTWPAEASGLLTLSPAQWEWLIVGVDWQRLSAEPNPQWQV